MIQTTPHPAARSWLIVADDLTGAADCAVAFAKRGIAAQVGWGDAGWSDHDGSLAEGAAVFSYDAASRELPARECLARLRGTLDRFLGGDRILFKKIDSTLRGQPAIEVATAMVALRDRTGSAFGILAPAFPATGRTTADGRVHVHGKPLETTELWQRDHSYPTADLAEILATVGITGMKVPLELIRGNIAALQTAFRTMAAKDFHVAICDAETEDDLARIAAANSPAPDNLLFIGSAGLAHALADAMPATQAPPALFEHSVRGSLIVVGSQAEASRAAAQRLSLASNTRHLPVAPAALLRQSPERLRLLSEVIEGLDAGEDVLVEILLESEPDLAGGSVLSAALARILAPAARHIGAVAATGGETASSLLEALGIHAIRLVDEIAPGICLGQSFGALSIPVITKAGAFGDADSLIHIADCLRRIKLGGRLA